MSKHHHQNRAEQIYNKAHGAASFRHEEMSYEVAGPIKSEEIQETKAVNINSIPLRIGFIMKKVGLPWVISWKQNQF